MIKYITYCDRCNKEIPESYMHIVPSPCLKEKDYNPIVANSLSKPLDFCLECWKEVTTKLN